MKTNATHAQVQEQEKETFFSLGLGLCLRGGRCHGEIRTLVLALSLLPVLASLVKTMQAKSVKEDCYVSYRQYLIIIPRERALDMR